MPSMVVICLLPAAATGVTQERIGRPSSCTVQAPHSAIPQPNFVPVRPMTSRSTQSSGMSPGTSTVWDVPLMLNVTMVPPLALKEVRPSASAPQPLHHFSPRTGTFQGELDAASQAVFHKSWGDATVRFPELRGFMHAELYTPAGQRP